MMVHTDSAPKHLLNTEYTEGIGPRGVVWEKGPATGPQPGSLLVRRGQGEFRWIVWLSLISGHTEGVPGKKVSWGGEWAARWAHVFFFFLQVQWLSWWLGWKCWWWEENCSGMQIKWMNRFGRWVSRNKVSRPRLRNYSSSYKREPDYHHDDHLWSDRNAAPPNLWIAEAWRAQSEQVWEGLSEWDSTCRQTSEETRGRDRETHKLTYCSYCHWTSLIGSDHRIEIFFFFNFMKFVNSIYVDLSLFDRFCSCRLKVTIIQ